MVKRPAKKRSIPLESTVRIGKRGLTEAQIKEISKHLNTRKKVKIKVLKSALTESTIENLAQKAASETDSKIIQVIGHIFTLYKPQKRKRKKEKLAAKA